MVREYNGYYRTALSKEEKKAFKDKAIKEGSVTEIHDKLIRDYIKSQPKEGHP